MDNFVQVTYQNLFDYDSLDERQKVHIGRFLQYTNPLGLVIRLSKENSMLYISDGRGILTSPLYYDGEEQRSNILAMLGLMCDLKGIDPYKDTIALLQEEARSLREENTRLKAAVVKLGGSDEQLQAETDVTGENPGAEAEKSTKKGKGRPPKAEGNQLPSEEYKHNLQLFEDMVPQFAETGASLEIDADTGKAIYHSPKRKKPIVYDIMQDYAKVRKTLQRRRSTELSESAYEQPEPAESCNFAEMSHE